MTERPAILSAKMEKLAEVIADGQTAKKNMTVSDARAAQAEALSEILGAGGSVSEVKSIETPSERLE